MKREFPSYVRYLIESTIFIAIMFLLYKLSRSNYLFFHSIVEMFSIAVAFGIFMLVWNARQHIDSSMLLIIGIGLIFIGAIDMIHTLAYKGMGVFPDYKANIPTQLWIAARYMHACTFLFATFYITKRISPTYLFSVYFSVTALLFASIFVWDTFPDCYIEGSGLTPFKKGSEYLISIIFCLSVVRLFIHRFRLDREMYRLMATAIILTVCAELLFTFYVSVYGLSNFLGHVFKIISFYLIYKALIVIGLRRPYDLLFRDLKQNEEALREREAELIAIYDNAPLLMLLVDEERRLQKANLAAINFTGRSIEDMIGLRGGEALRCIHSVDDPRGCGFGRHCESCKVRQTVVETFKTRKSHYQVEASLQFEHIDKETTLLVSTNLLDLDRARRVLVCIEDITDRKQAEEELTEYRDRLEDLVNDRTTDLEQANIRLTEMDRMKSMFIASMSHELRTPLNSILGFTGIILDGMSGEINPKQREQLNRAHRSAHHLLAMITDIIDISRIESGKMTFSPDKFSLDSLVDEAIEVVQDKAKQKGLLISVDIPADFTMHTDRQRLLQCIINLLTNAVKFTEAGTVNISTSKLDKEVEISISDTGIGISEQDIPKLFHPFERLESHLKIKAGGTGLGLYLTRKLATEVLKGSVEVVSEEGKGSTFRLRVPRDIAGIN